MLGWLRRFYESIDLHLRLTALRWAFLVVGIVAIARDDMVLVWIAWSCAMATGFLGVRRHMLYGLFVMAFLGVCVLVYHWINLWLSGTQFGALPHAGEYPGVIAYAGVMMEVLFALLASHGRYEAEHAPWQTEQPLSRTYIPAELKRRSAMAEQERKERQPPAAN